MKAAEIRRKFIEYFESKAHQHVASASLIPSDDPTLLFTNAGMNQFKDAFLGREDRGYKRACSVQKCVRAGGKHNDLDNVGYTDRHHTFFEMLGNFSFGDYFKAEACQFAWEFLTQELAIPVDRLYVTVYEEDDEAFALWRDQIGVAEDRIFRFGKKDNFWSMGPVGPCGPCSEIFYDYGDAVEGPADPYEAIASGSDKVVEVWNLVFMQFDAQEDGSMIPLPNPSIDTGMGLERIASVMAGATSNYHTDLFVDLMEPIAAGLGIDAQKRSAEEVTGLRVIADHLRAMSHLIADGVVPSNEGRGYVLRRIMRRAMRYGKQLGQDKPFLHQMVKHVVQKIGEFYPELLKEQSQIELLVKVEEEQFANTLDRGMPILLKYLEDLKARKESQVPGQILHYMYGTLGFPVDLMGDIARDWDMTLDRAGLDELLAADAQQADQAAFTAKKVHPQLEEDAQNYATNHTVYQGLAGSGKVMRMLLDEAVVERLAAGQEGQVVLDATSFYAESGGQIGDKGTIETPNGKFQVESTTKVLDKLILHKGKVLEGTLAVGEVAQTKVDAALRADTMRNHTATHILHKALRDVVGLHVRQAGSLVEPDKLRFDFSHFAPLDQATIAEVERRVNQQILANEPVLAEEMDQEAALKSGALAFFGDKYGATVRVITVGGYSKEFCGGTHVQATGEIGPFKIISERGLAAGVRRLVALTGPKAIERFSEDEALLQEAQDRFQIKREHFIESLEKMQAEKRELEARVEALKMELAKGGSAQETIEDLGAFKVMAKAVKEVAGGQLRQLADEMLHKVPGGVVLLASDNDGKAQLVVKSLVKTVHAGKLVGAMAEEVGGRGGGKPDMAMAGGKDVSKLQDALDKGLRLLREMAATS